MSMCCAVLCRAGHETVSMEEQNHSAYMCIYEKVPAKGGASSPAVAVRDDVTHLAASVSAVAAGFAFTPVSTVPPAVVVRDDAALSSGASPDTEPVAADSAVTDAEGVSAPGAGAPVTAQEPTPAASTDGNA
jgi:hypothetical protein